MIEELLCLFHGSPEGKGPAGMRKSRLGSETVILTSGEAKAVKTGGVRVGRVIEHNRLIEGRRSNYRTGLAYHWKM